MKVFIVKQASGEYDGYSEIIDSTYLVPDDFDEEALDTLKAEFDKFWPKKKDGFPRAFYSGKSYEYAWLECLTTFLSQFQQFEMIENTVYFRN